MFSTDLPERADAFRRMHQPDAGRVLVLPNAWDAMSARVIEDAGARAAGERTLRWTERSLAHARTRTTPTGLPQLLFTIVQGAGERIGV